jgi:hypothetical protein
MERNQSTFLIHRELYTVHRDTLRPRFEFATFESTDLRELESGPVLN